VGWLSISRDAKAFSAEVDTGSAKENATSQGNLERILAPGHEQVVQYERNAL